MTSGFRAGPSFLAVHDRPSDFDVVLTLPAKQTVASTGRLVHEQPSSGGEKTLLLRAERVRGFTIYASLTWRKFRAKERDIDLEVCVPTEAEKWATPILDTMAGVIRFYEQHYGQFPSRHLAMICPGNLAGRAHGSSAACNAITVWLSTQFETQYKWLIAHEVAHQYWGSSIGLHRTEIAWSLIGLGM